MEAHDTLTVEPNEGEGERRHELITPPSAGLACPECGRTFMSNQGLAAHRSRSHQIAGTSNRARRRKQQPAKKTLKAAPAPAPLNTERILKEMFPNGIKAEQYARVSAWVAEAVDLHAIHNHQPKKK